MIRPKNETEGLLLSITKNFEQLIKQTHRKAEIMLKYKVTKPRESFLFNPSITSEGSWMIGFLSVEVYIFIFKITEENSKFELFADDFDDFPLEELEGELEEFDNFSNVTSEHLQDEIIRPRIIPAYRKLKTEKRHTDGYYML